MLNLAIFPYIFCRLLTERTSSLLTEVDSSLEELEALEDSAALNFVNALEDLLWAFERRATASYIFQLAVNRSIYRHNVFRYSLQSLTPIIFVRSCTYLYAFRSAFHVHSFLTT